MASSTPSFIEVIDANEGRDQTLRRVDDCLRRSASGEDKFIRVKGGKRLLDQNGWVDFLAARTYLAHDKRHFDFGEGLSIADWWEISNQPEKESSYAYSTTPQPLHCDNAWFGDPAEINFFIMEKQAVEGGAQTLYHLKDLMEDLTQDDPELLSKLTTVPVVIQKGNTELANHTTIIQDGDSPRIFWNYYRTRRDSEEISEMCERFFSWLKKQEKTDRVKKARMESGDCFFFNDQKMLHGRTSFKASVARERILLQSMWRRAASIGKPKVNR